jgi:hypothetical protein
VSPCHQTIARPLVADGGYVLQIQWLAANKLKNPSRIADKWQSSSLKTGRRANKFSLYKPACYEMLHSDSELDGYFVSHAKGGAQSEGV